MNNLEKRILRFFRGQPKLWAMQKTGVERSIGQRVGGALDKLAKSGLVEKTPGGLYGITAKGREAIDEQDAHEATSTA